MAGDNSVEGLLLVWDEFIEYKLIFAIDGGLT
jgi:hypothetical protein